MAHPVSALRGHDGIDERLDHIAELFSEMVADSLCILQVGRDEATEVNRIANAEEDVPIGQLAWPRDPVDLPLQFENHFRQSFLRRVQIHVLRLPASHLGHTLERCQVKAEPRAT